MHRRDLLLAGLAGLGGSLAVAQLSPRLPVLGGGSANHRTYGGRTITRRDPSPDAPNVLFISIDDLNDWQGFLRNHPGTRTPAMDALAASGLAFANAYVTAPMCLPSRTSTLFGRAPHTTGVYDHTDASKDAYQVMADATTALPDDFWAAGYTTYGAGKIFNRHDDARWNTTFSVPHWAAAGDRDNPDVRFDPDWISPYTGEPIGSGEEFTSGDIDFGPGTVPLSEEPDSQTIDWAIDRLRGHDRHRPFFMGVGLVATHDPWRVPQQFFDQHPLDEVVVPEYLGPDEDDLADLGPYAREQIIDTFGAFERVLEADAWAPLVQAYQAATSFADHNVGRLLEAIEDSPHAADTIVVLWSDNGFHVGEKQHLHKFTLWEPATHVPLVIRAPQLGTGTFDAPVSLLHLGPTVADLAGVEVLDDGHQGTSLVGAIQDPDQTPPPAIMTWLEGNHAVRRDRWRFIRYADGETELYDLAEDPDEWANLADDPDHASTVEELQALLPTAG